MGCPLVLKREKKGFREDGGQKILSLAKILIGDIRWVFIC